MREQLIELLEPGLAGLGYDLVDVEYSSGRKSALLRVYIDRAEGITLDDCARVSDQVSGILDVEDPIPGAYTLEVSSPGEKRIIRTRQHYEAHLGQRVKVQLRTACDGRLRLTGELLQLDGDEVVFRVDGATIRVPFESIDRTRLAPQL